MAESYSNGQKNTVGKEEIARYEQILLFPQCFQKACFPEVSKGVIVWEWVKAIFVLNFKHEFFPFITIFSRQFVHPIFGSRATMGAR